mmetsp:Transcript_37692/g.87017  ORF Transcript_37692/g.87017 Transcript_37692/m.87017 type:complete len:578 (+) Transcript_37692:70-1803(+)
MELGFAVAGTAAPAATQRPKHFLKPATQELSNNFQTGARKEANQHSLLLPCVAVATAVAVKQRTAFRSKVARAALGTSKGNREQKRVELQITRQAATATVEVAAPDVDFDEDEEEEPKGAKDGEFNWKKAWYPVNVTEIMDPVRPHKTQLLGMNIVMWNDGKTVNGEKQMGEWHVMLDACPHRSAPLSEGRVEEDGTLLCSYHAWRFNGSGECVKLPYSPDELEEKHRCNARACCKVFPSRVEDGLLFVWPELGEEAFKESAKKDPPLIEELHDPELSKKWVKFPTNLRDLDLGWDVFFENAMDPAHFLVAHHNVTGNRYTDPKWFDMQTFRKLSTDRGCAARGIPGIFDFRPPCLVKNQQDGGVIFAIYNTPTSPGHCRHIGFLVLDTETIAGDSGVVDKDAVSMFTGPVPIWLQHVTTSFFLHQDAVLLHHQEQNFRDMGYLSNRENAKKFQEVTYTPNEVDKGSIQFRRWLATRGGGGVDWQCDPTLPPRMLTNDKIFDVWNSHTRHCKKCLEAYNNIVMLKNGAFGSAFAVALAAPEGVERIVGGVLAVAVGGALMKLQELFERYEFNHQDNN